MLRLYTGPMFCGKTTSMIRDAVNNSLTENKTIIIKYCNDIRYSSELFIITHSGIEFKSDTYTTIIKSNGTKLMLCEIPDDVTLIGIDEGQFYDDLVEFCTFWSRKGKSISVSALDGDYKMHKFGQVCDLIPICDTVKKLNGICMVCKSNPSSFTVKLTDNPDIIDIGSKDKYKSACRACFYKITSPCSC